MTPKRWLLLTSCLLPLASWASLLGAQTVLTPEQPIERGITQGETQRLEVDLPADHYVTFAVRQRNADIALTLFSPEGKSLVTIDFRAGLRGTEPLDWVTSAPGRYRLEVHGLEAAKDGSYRASIEALHPAAPRDADRVRGERDYLLGTRASRDGDLERAAVLLERSLEFWRQSQDLQGQAKVLHTTGLTLKRQGNIQRAIIAYRQAIALWPDSDRRSRADTLQNLGDILLETGQAEEALIAYQKAFEIYRAYSLRSQAALSRKIGKTRHARLEPEKALAAFHQALQLSRAAESRPEIIQALVALGQAYDDYGEDPKALETLLEAREVLRSIPQEKRQSAGWLDLEASVMNELGIVYQKLGQYDPALLMLERAFELSKNLGQERKALRSLTNIGWTYYLSEKLPRALETFKQSLEALDAIQDPYAIAATHNNMGRTHHALKDFERSQHHYQVALSLYRDLDDVQEIANTQLKIVELLLDQGKAQDALDRITATRRLPEPFEVQDEIRAVRLEAQGHFLLGRIEDAVAGSEKVIDDLERRRVSLNAVDQRADLQARFWHSYEQAILHRMALAEQNPGQGHERRALEIYERGRGRSFIELLRHVPFKTETDILSQQKNRVQRRLNALELRRFELRRQSGEDPQTEAALRTVEKELQATLIDYQTTLGKLQGRSQANNAFLEPPPPSAEDIIANLDTETLLLEFSLGENQSFLWIITHQDVHGFALPPRETIEDLAREFYDLLTARAAAPEGETPSERRRRWQEADERLAESGARLSHLLLEPATSFLGNRRLVIVADGALEYLPFSALPTPGRDGASPLITQHELLHLPSASVLGALRRRSASRPNGEHLASSSANPSRAEASFLIIADPVFDPADPRLAGHQTLAQKPPSTSGRQVSNEAAPTHSALRRLPFTRREAEAISALLPARQSRTLLDFEASREMIEAQDLTRFTVLHFATHGLLDHRHPELSALALSMVDSDGRNVDGFLRLHDLYDLNLAARLVVLSACETALGQQIRGEGLMGLTRGFFHAGADRVLASLWTVQDRATMTLMTRFYQAFLDESLPPAQALRQAQLRLLAHPRFAHPYYWAGFILQGDWQ